MSNIIILFHQEIIVKDEITPQIVCNYEAFSTELKKIGNNVKIINTNYIKDYWESKISKLNKTGADKFLCELKKFNPDLIFAFNNQVFLELFQTTSCPICCMDADSIDLFPNKDFIKQYNDRYFLITSYSGWEDSSYSALGIKSSRVGKIHSATAIEREDLIKDKNISFIGSVFAFPSRNIIEKIHDKQKFIDDVKKYFLHPYEECNPFIDKYTKELHTDCLGIYSLIDPRLNTLYSILDLGLTVYGINWQFVPDTLYLLKLVYDKTPKYSLKHNQDVYNSSKINFSVSHPQCRGYTYPWRVFDIMASSGLLISSYSKLLEEQTKGYVKIPMYKSPWEARELCKYALNNPNWAKDIVAASNEYIEKFGRWKDNFEKIESLVGVKLINEEKVANSTYEIIQIDKGFNKKKAKYKFNLKGKIKNIINGISLVLMNLPVFEFLYSKKIKEKIYHSINKYRGN